MKEPQYHAWISWLSPKKGGRDAVPLSRSRADVRFENQKTWPEEGWTLVIDSVKTFKNSRLQVVRIDFLVDEAPHHLIVAGTRFEILDGARVVANGMVVDADSVADVTEQAVEEVLWV